jgi:UDP-glucuronate decarboxylase
VSEKQTLLSLETLLCIDLDYICREMGNEFSRMSGKKLLITGGAGFLGYYFTLSALHWNKRNKGQLPISVSIVDNYKRGVPGWLETVKNNKNLRLFTDDISRPLRNNFIVADYIIHAAGIASPTFYRRYPLETIDANINGLRNLLEHCRQRINTSNPVLGFLFMSSSEIYGDPSPENIPTPEDYRGSVSCTGPRACYDESKRFGETICVVYAQQFGLPVTMARPFNNYGPGLKITDGRVLPDFMRNIMRNEDIVLLSDGSPTRTFCYAADAVCGYYKALVRGSSGESYNIGTEKPEVSMRELSEKVAELGRRYLSYNGKVRFGISNEKDYLTDNPNRRCPIIQKARNDIGYNPGVPLDEGLYRLLSWYSHNPAAEEA